MVDPTGVQLQPPTDWQAFERVTRSLFEYHYACSIAQRVGRDGQEQEGLDIIGQQGRAPHYHFGIQCKLKDQLGRNRKLRRDTLEKELAAAEAIEPPIDEFILATTAANDVDLQKHAQRLQAERADGPRPIKVRVVGWDDMRSLIGEHRELYERYLGIVGISHLKAAMNEQFAAAEAGNVARHAEVMATLAQVTGSEPPAQIVAPPLDPEDPRLSRQINRIKARLDSNDVRIALADLQALREEEWDAIGPSYKFRIVSNLGAAHWRLGEYDEAAALFREAAGYQPDDKVALANLAAAMIHAGEPAEALCAARRLAELDPASPDALLPLIQAQELVAPLPDPMSLVPPRLRDSEEALVGGAQVLRNRGDAGWINLVVRGAKLHPESDFLARMNADATLYRLAMVEGSHVGADGVDVPTRDEIVAAADILDKAWQRTLACQPTNADLSGAQNLAQLLRALERHAEALAILEQAEAFGDEEPKIAHLHALLLMALDRREEAKERLKTHVADPACLILLCQISEDAPAEVAALLDGRVMPVGSREAMWGEVLAAEARGKLDATFDPVPALEVAAANGPDSLIPLLALGKHAEGPEELEAIAVRLFAAIGRETRFADRLQAGAWFREAKMPARVAALFEDHIRFDEDSPALRWLIEAWYSIGDRRALHDALCALPERVANIPLYLHYRQRAAEQSGDIDAAIKVSRRLVADRPDNIGVRLDWIHVVHRTGERAEIMAWLEGPVERLEGSPSQHSDLALVLANFGYYDRARRLAYRQARIEPDNPHILRRFSGVMFNPAPAGRSDLALTRIGPDAVFTLIDGAGREEIYRIDGESDLPRESFDLGPESPIARAASGLSAGEAFELPSNLWGTKPKRFTVKAVRHKHLHLLDTLTNSMSDRFDEAPVVYRTTIDPEDPASLDQIVAHLKANEEHARAINEDYLENSRLLRVTAMLHGRDIIDTYDALCSGGDTWFVCSDGGGPEYDHERRALPDNRRRGCVVDSITLELIRRHDLIDVVHALAGPVHIGQGALDDVIGRAEKGALLMGGYRGNMSQRGGRLAIDPIYPATLEGAIAGRRAALDWVRANTRPQPAIGGSRVARALAGMIPREAGHQFVDEILIAMDTDLLLLSDDLGYRRLAGHVGIGRRAGLAALLHVAFERGTIDHERYVGLLSALGHARHRFLAVTAADLALAFGTDKGMAGPKLRGLAMHFGGPRAFVAVQWPEAETFLEWLWAEDEHVASRIAVITLFADRLLSEVPGLRAAFSSELFANPETAPAALGRAVAASLGRRHA